MIHWPISYPVTPFAYLYHETCAEVASWLYAHTSESKVSLAFSLYKVTEFRELLDKGWVVLEHSNISERRFLSNYRDSRKYNRAEFEVRLYLDAAFRFHFLKWGIETPDGLCTLETY